MAIPWISGDIVLKPADCAEDVTKCKDPSATIFSSSVGGRRRAHQWKCAPALSFFLM